MVKEHKTPSPLDTFPGVKVGDDEANGPAVFAGERLAIVFEREKDVGTQKIVQRDIGGVAFFGEDENEFGAWLSR